MGPSGGLATNPWPACGASRLRSMGNGIKITALLIDLNLSLRRNFWCPCGVHLVSKKVRNWVHDSEKVETSEKSEIFETLESM